MRKQRRRSGNREADQRLCFRYMDSTISLLPKYGISSLQPSSVAVQPGLCGTWSETPTTGFLTTRLILFASGICTYRLAEIWNGDCGMIVNVKNIRSTGNPSVAYTRTVYVTVGSDTIVIDQKRKITVSKYFSHPTLRIDFLFCR